MSRVLVADDHEDVLRLLSLTLELEGYEVGTAIDGAEAVARASNERPGAIVMDVMMPRLNGLEALRRLRQSADTAAIPVLFVSGKTGAADVEAGLAGGAAGYLTKPFEPADLLARLAALVEPAPAEPDCSSAVDGPAVRCSSCEALVGLASGTGPTGAKHFVCPSCGAWFGPRQPN